jgi:hypothetical protein
VNPTHRWLNELVRLDHPVIRRLRETANAMREAGELGVDVSDLSDAQFVDLLCGGPDAVVTPNPMVTEENRLTGGPRPPEGGEGV